MIQTSKSTYAKKQKQKTSQEIRGKQSSALCKPRFWMNYKLWYFYKMFANGFLYRWMI